MEEDINIIKLIMNETYSNLVNIDGKRIYKLSDRKRQAIENLINRNRTLEKEIKLMKSVNLEDNYISKSKVREKIEFYKRYGKIKNSNEYVMSVEIFVLEELLEEGDK